MTRARARAHTHTHTPVSVAQPISSLHAPYDTHTQHISSSASQFTAHTVWHTQHISISSSASQFTARTIWHTQHAGYYNCKLFPCFHLEYLKWQQHASLWCSWDSVVSVVTGWGLDHPGIQMVAGARDFLLQNCPYQLWGPPPRDAVE